MELLTCIVQDLVTLLKESLPPALLASFNSTWILFYPDAPKDENNRPIPSKRSASLRLSRSSNGSSRNGDARRSHSNLLRRGSSTSGPREKSPIDRLATASILEQ
ncbi:hypothetical protein HDU91_001620 [Kappamyces sp. JEL0680]|nr:hypothetical protein HDU91_001620 [Kappamyces sp. JEL0680]